MIQPGPHRLLIAPSPVDDNEEDHPSGLVVVREPENRERIARGVVLRVGKDVEEQLGEALEGSAVYYDPNHALPIGEDVIVLCGRIEAWEGNHGTD